MQERFRFFRRSCTKHRSSLLEWKIARYLCILYKSQKKRAETKGTVLSSFERARGSPAAEEGDSMNGEQPACPLAPRLQRGPQSKTHAGKNRPPRALSLRVSNAGRKARPAQAKNAPRLPFRSAPPTRAAKQDPPAVQAARGSTISSQVRRGTRRARIADRRSANCRPQVRELPTAGPRIADRRAANPLIVRPRAK